MKYETELHFMCGKAGAGKSTLAATLTQQHNAVLLREDIWQARLFKDELVTFTDYIKYSRRIKLVVAPLVADLLAKQSVVLDFPANTRGGRNWFRSIFEQANCGHTLQHLEARNELFLQRIAKRNVERPEGSHELDEATFNLVTSYFQPPSADEGFNICEHPQGIDPDHYSTQKSWRKF